jgi:hypothetical protein
MEGHHQQLNPAMDELGSPCDTLYYGTVFYTVLFTSHCAAVDVTSKGIIPFDLKAGLLRNGSTRNDVIGN